MFCATARSVLMHSKLHEKYQFSSISHVVMLIIIHTYIHLFDKLEISNCTADVDLLLLSVDERTKIYNTII